MAFFICCVRMWVNEGQVVLIHWAFQPNGLVLIKGEGTSEYKKHSEQRFQIEFTML